MKKIILLIILIPGIVLSQEYLALKHIKSKKYFENTATVLDLESNSKIAEIDFGKSYKSVGEFLNLKDTSKLYYYMKTSKNLAALKVFDATNYNHLYTVDIDPLSVVLGENYSVLTFFDVSPDFKTLFIQTQKKNYRQILVLNNNTGELLTKIPLGKGKVFSKLTNDGKYILTHKYKGGKSALIDTTSFEATYQSAGNKKPPLYYDNSVFRIIGVNSKAGKAKKLKIHNLINGQDISVDKYFTDEPLFYQDEESNKLYIFGQSRKTSKFSLFAYSSQKVSKVNTVDKKFRPKYLISQPDSDNVLINGAGEIAIFNPHQPQELNIINTPFDIADMATSSDNRKLFVKEGSGSEVAALDIESGKLIGRSGTGRAGVKFGQFLGSVTIAAIGAGIGYIPIYASYSNTAMKFNRDETRLYVINTKTHDVTAFNASDLSGREALETGKGSSLIYRAEIENAPVIVLTSSKLTIINDSDLKSSSQIEFETLLGVDFDNNYTFVKQGPNVNCYSMNDGSLIKSLAIQNPALIRPKIPASL